MAAGQEHGVGLGQHGCQRAVQSAAACQHGAARFSRFPQAAQAAPLDVFGTVGKRFLHRHIETLAVETGHLAVDPVAAARAQVDEQQAQRIAAAGAGVAAEVVPQGIPAVALAGRHVDGDVGAVVAVHEAGFAEQQRGPDGADRIDAGDGHHGLLGNEGAGAGQHAVGQDRGIARGGAGLAGALLHGALASVEAWVVHCISWGTGADSALSSPVRLKPSLAGAMDYYGWRSNLRQAQLRCRPGCARPPWPDTGRGRPPRSARLPCWRAPAARRQCRR